MVTVVPNNAPFSIEIEYSVAGFPHKMTFQTGHWVLKAGATNPLDAANWVAANGTFSPLTPERTALSHVQQIWNVMMQWFSGAVSAGSFTIIDNQAGIDSVGIPVAYAGLSGVGGVGGSAYEPAGQFTFTARTSGGKGARITFFESGLETPSRQRWSANQGAFFEGLWTSMTVQGIWRGRDGEPVVRPLFATGTLNRKLRRARRLA